MKNEILKQIISQIKKYHLDETFSDVEQFKKWVSSLSDEQINNFLNLDIDYEEIKNINYLLINKDLLNCKDYIQKVFAIATLKNGDGCWHLFSYLCSPNFLRSKNFYKDIEMLSKANTARYGLQILGEDSFIRSPYHDEDLKLLVETHDIKETNPLDYVVSEVIATVASNSDSIKSPYHREDMQLIASVGSEYLQSKGSYPESSLNNLAINKVSLTDKYHLENMKILADNPIASEFLYIIMTEHKFIKGKNYRKEIEALVRAKSKPTARALYYYIVNPDRKYLSDIDYLSDCDYDVNDAHISDRDSVSGSNDPDYLKYLIKINEFDDKYVMYFVSLLMNPYFIKSEYKKFDLELLQTVSDRKIFMDLYIFITDVISLNSASHKKDAVIISQTKDENIRKLLLKKTIDKYNFNEDSHDYDMEYISKLNLESIDKEILEEMKYYLFTGKGIKDPQRKEKLEKLLQGILVERKSSISDYLDSLENKINKDISSSSQIIEPSKVKSRPKSKILSLIQKYIQK